MIRFIGEYKRPIGPSIRAALLFVALLAAAFLAGRFTAPKERRGNGAKVTVNPSVHERKSADLTVKESLSGAGRSFIPAPRHQNDDLKPSASAPNWFKPGDTLSQPFSGEVRASFIESGSGVSLGEGSFPVQGSTTATFTESGLQIETLFEGEPEIAVTLPESAPKRFEVGVLAGINTDREAFAGGYGRMNLAVWRLGGVEISPWLGAAGLRDKNGFEGCFLVGVGGRF